jgi:uncharacterized protein (DUF305 family)
MNNKIIIISLLSFILGTVLTIGYTSLQKNSALRMHNNEAEKFEAKKGTCEPVGFGNSTMNNEMTNDMRHNMDMHSQMNSMTSSLENKTGEDFDKEFLSQMIIHHEGAVDMAKMALENASHQEIKDLATAIIEAQEKEISQMKEWQTNWGY